ncbi:MAG: hypothetical protein ABIU07_05625, partial [Ramlibacter sp.]
MRISRSNIVKAAAATALAFAALGTASVAQARDNINWSVGINAAPGVVIGATNSRYYAPPVYVQPQTYYQGNVYPSNVYPSSYYVEPAPVYVAPPVYYRPAPVYYGYGPSIYYRNGHRHGHRRLGGIETRSKRFSPSCPRSARRPGAFFMRGGSSFGARTDPTHKKRPPGFWPGGNMPVAGRRAGPA